MFKSPESKRLLKMVRVGAVVAAGVGFTACGSETAPDNTILQQGEHKAGVTSDGVLKIGKVATIVPGSYTPADLRLKATVYESKASFEFTEEDDPYADLEVNCRSNGPTVVLDPHDDTDGIIPTISDVHLPADSCDGGEFNEETLSALKSQAYSDAIG